MANLGGPLASRKWKVGDRVESVANGKPTGCFGTVVRIPKEGRSQVHFFVTIRWDEPKLGAIESKISPAALIEVERRENPARKPERGFVYWNLHKDLYSVRVTGKPVQAATAVRVRDADLVVQPGGRKRVLETKQKSVHAGVRGEVEIADDFKIPGKGWIRVRYDPYQFASFVRVDNEEPVLESPEVIMVIREGRPRVYAKESAAAKAANPMVEHAANPTVDGWKLVKRTMGKIRLHGSVRSASGPVFEQWKRGQYILTLTRDQYRGVDVIDIEVRGPHGDSGVYNQLSDIRPIRPHAMAFANRYMDLPPAEQATGAEDPNWLWEHIDFARGRHQWERERELDGNPARLKRMLNPRSY